MRLLDLSGMSYNPLSRRYSLGRDIDVNYLVTAGFDA
jgi:2-polyprenyl-3-methyl-5-hydroxy-6-metoxy-1,4-benzoquinol methylase